MVTTKNLVQNNDVLIHLCSALNWRYRCTKYSTPDPWYFTYFASNLGRFRHSTRYTDILDLFFLSSTHHKYFVADVRFGRVLSTSSYFLSQEQSTLINMRTWSAYRLPLVLQSFARGPLLINLAYKGRPDIFLPHPFSLWTDGGVKRGT